MTSLLRGLVAALLVAGVIATGSPAQAAGCSGGSGVTVVVDFGTYGGVQTGCAPDPHAGLDALTQAGFDLTLVTGSPFVCRIDGVPADAGCARIPPADAYWAYWEAAPGGDWVYSSLGAASTRPGPGTTEGWAFGADAVPGIPPPPNVPPPNVPPPTTASTTVPAPPPAPPAPPATTTPTPKQVATSAAVSPTPGSSTSEPLPTVAASSSASTGATGSSPAGPSTPASTGTARANTATEQSPAPRAPWGVLVAVVAAAVLGAGAWWHIRRRG